MVDAQRKVLHVSILSNVLFVLFYCTYQCFDELLYESTGIMMDIFILAANNKWNEKPSLGNLRCYVGTEP